MSSTLTGPEQEHLLDAVISGFGDTDLQHLMLHKLDVSLYEYVTKGSLRAVVGELIPWLCSRGLVDRFLDAIAGARPDNSIVQQAVNTLRGASATTSPAPQALQHPLHAFPLTGRVEMYWITDDLFQAYGEAVKRAYRDLALGRVAAAVRSSNPEANRAYLVSSGECPTDLVPDDEFCLAALNLARLKSPRTLAAFLLYAASTNGFGPKAMSDRNLLLEHIKSLPRE